MLTGAYAASYAYSFHLNALSSKQVDYFIVLYLSFDWILLGLDDSQHTSSLQSSRSLWRPLPIFKTSIYGEFHRCFPALSFLTDAVEPHFAFVLSFIVDELLSRVRDVLNRLSPSV